MQTVTTKWLLSLPEQLHQNQHQMQTHGPVCPIVSQSAKTPWVADSTRRPLQTPPSPPSPPSSSLPLSRSLQSIEHQLPARIADAQSLRLKAQKRHSE